MSITHTKVVTALDSIAPLVERVPSVQRSDFPIFGTEEDKAAYEAERAARIDALRNIGATFVEAATGRVADRRVANRNDADLVWLGGALVEKYQHWLDMQDRPQPEREGFAEGMVGMVDLDAMTISE